MDVAFAQHTDPGVVREENQDAMGYFSSAAGRLFVVCDGMGGHVGGRVASRLAVDVIGETFVAKTGLEPDALLRACIDAANSAVHERAQRLEGEDLEGMGTTAVLCLVDDAGESAHLAWAGDSRIYLLRDGQLRQLTRDHTIVQQLIDEGRLDPERAPLHPHHGVLSRALGIAANLEPELGEPLELRDQDRLLLCSDGLTTMIDDEDLLRYLREYPYRVVGEELLALARARGGYDNITVQIVHIGRPPERASISESGLARISDLLAESDAKRRPKRSAGSRRGPGAGMWVLLALSALAASAAVYYAFLR